MKAESQPVKSNTHVHKLSVAEVMEILKDAPPDALIRFKDGGVLEASIYSAWKETEVVERPHRTPFIQTQWI